MMNDNLDLIARFFDAYGSHDLSGIRQVVAENAKWTFPGHSPLSGTKAGIDEIVAFFDTMGSIMGKSNVQVEKLVTGVNEAYVVECQHVSTHREDGNNLDQLMSVLWKFENGRIIEGSHLIADEQSADAFYRQAFVA